MKNFQKILRIFLIFLGLTGAIYLAICFVVPYFLNSRDYSGIISDAVKKQVNLDLKIHNYKIKISPRLNLTIDAENVQLFYPNKSQIFDIENVNLDFSTPALFQKELKLEKISADKVQFSTKLLKNGKFTLQEHLEKNFKENAESTLKISDNIPDIRIKSLLIKIKDEKSSQKFKLEAQNLNLERSILARTLKLSAEGALYCFSDKITDFRLKFAFPHQLTKNFEPKPVQIPFSDFNRYKMSAKLDIDLSLNEKSALNGKINVSDFTMKSANGMRLPPSHFYFKFGNNSGSMDAEFYTAKEERAALNAKFALNGAKKLHLKCTAKKLSLKNLRPVLISLSEILNIQNNLNEFEADGYLTSDFVLDTDFKAITSSGRLSVVNGSLKHKSIPLKISEINSDISFDGNEVNINKSSLFVNNQPVKLAGKIDKNAWGNLTLSAENLSLANILNAFSFFKLPDKIKIKSGTLSFNAQIKGKLDKISPKINAEIKNFLAFCGNDRFSVEKASSIITEASDEHFKGTLSAQNVKYSPAGLPKSLISKHIEASFDENNLKLNPSKFSYDKAIVTVSGTVNDYKKAQNANFSLFGTVDSAFLRSLLPKELNIYAKGVIPVGASVISKNGKIDIQANALAMPDAYISPVILRKKGNTLLHADLNFEDNLLKIKEIALTEPPASVKLSQNVDISRLKHLITLKGEIKTPQNPIFNNLQIKIPQNLVFSAEPVDSAAVQADLRLNGSIKSPDISGILSLSDIKIKEIYAKSIKIAPGKSYIKLNADSLKAGSTFASISAILPSNAALTKKINNLNITADYIDLQNLVKLTGFLPPAKYAPGFEAPFDIETGKIAIKSADINGLKLQNAVSDMNITKNILYLKNLRANAYGGNIAANVEHNILYTSTKAQIQARGLQSAAAALDILPVNTQISGKLDFDADISMSGLYQDAQMKTLKGNADILVTNAQLGPLGRFEHFLHAQNLLSQRFINASLNSAKRAIAPKNTGYVDNLKGKLKFNNGLIYLSPVTTAGPQMSMYITGITNIITGDVDLRILGRVSPDVSDSVGTLGDITLKNVLDEHTEYGDTIARLFTSYNAEIPEMDISKIPALTSKYQAETKNFRVIIAGNPESIKSIKSFTWVNPPGTLQQVKNITPAPESGQKTAEPVQKPNQTQVQPQQPKQPKPPAQNRSFLESIPDDFR